MSAAESQAFRPYKLREYATTKDVVTRLLDQAGGIKRSSHVLGRSPTQTTAYSDPATADEITYDMIRRLVDATGATAPAEDLAALARGIFVPVAPAPGNLEELVAHSSREWGEFVALIISATSAGKLQRLRRTEVLKELDSLIRTLVSVRTRIVNDRREP